MGGFVKETRSLHPAEGTASLTEGGSLGRGRGTPHGLGWGTQPWKSPCQLQAPWRGELWAFRSPAGAECMGCGWAAATGRQMISMGEFILGSPTLDSSPKLGVWRKVGDTLGAWNLAQKVGFGGRISFLFPGLQGVFQLLGHQNFSEKGRWVWVT